MRVDELIHALREASAAQSPADGDLEDVIRRRRKHQRSLVGVMTVVAVAAFVAGGAAAWLLARPDDDSTVTTDEIPENVAVAGEWTQLPDPPLPPRSNTTLVWTGEEVLVVGGDDDIECSPHADCAPTGDYSTFADGAAFDPTTERWRPIANAPVSLGRATTVVVGEDVYFLGGGAFLRYSLATDTWQQLPTPDGGASFLTAVDGGVVAAFWTAESGAHRDQLFSIETGNWRELPPDPLGPSLDRRMEWVDAHLYLFANDVVVNPDSEEPHLTRVARLDIDRGIWEELPPTESLGFGWVPLGLSLANGTEVIAPNLGSNDHVHPNGGIYDTAVLEWRRLPEAPDHAAGRDQERSTPRVSIGAIGFDRVWSTGDGRPGLILDLVTDTWIEVPGLNNTGSLDEPSVERNVVGTDGTLIAVGGESWAGGRGEVLGDAWVLTFERS